MICCAAARDFSWILFVKLKTWSSKIQAHRRNLSRSHLGKFSWKIGICA